MPKTYADVQRQYGLGADAYAPRDNILAGTSYLRQMYIRYGYPGMFAAYNAGGAFRRLSRAANCCGMGRCRICQHRAWL